jgi:hypothetical protein
MEFSMKKSKNFNISIFSKSCDFAGFPKEIWLYLGKVTTDFDFKTSDRGVIKLWIAIWPTFLG